MGLWGQHAYIYLEVGGDEIEDGSVVTTWATITGPTEEDIVTGVPHTHYETVECAVIYQ